MKKIAIVVQRYGTEVIGGSESFSRHLSEHLCKYFNVEVLTTCAVEYTTWKNEYSPGKEVINGVTVRRFPTGRERNYEFYNLHRKLICENHLTTILDELEYQRRQGPNSPQMLQFIKDKRNDYDLFVFVTFLFFTTFFGLLSVSDKAILVPTAHDVEDIYFDIFKSLFRSPIGIVYLSNEEQQFVQKTFKNKYIPSQVIGSGIDLVQGDAEKFRSIYNIKDPFVLYVGRIERAKGCLELINFFIRYKQENKSKLKLIFMGKQSLFSTDLGMLSILPKHSDIVNLGILSEGDKKDALAAASFLLQPSQHESFSLVLMESWAQKKPVLVNGISKVMKGHAERSNGGLYYTSYLEFAECMDIMLSNSGLCRKLGENGFEYVKQNYSWDKVEKKYVDFIESAADMVQRCE